jgi:hypothetical protein
VAPAQLYDASLYGELDVGLDAIGLELMDLSYDMNTL